MATTTTLRSALRNYRLSALIAQRAAREVRKARGVSAITSIIVMHQVANADTSRTSVREMLQEQGIPDLPLGRIDPAAFTVGANELAAMMEAIDKKAAQLLDRLDVPKFVARSTERLAESLVQDAGRAAEHAGVVVRPQVSHVRFVNTPCCSRCAVLAGAVYKWSSSFLRHPQCDCAMIPSTVASPHIQDPEELFRQGQIRGMSQADIKAVNAGADLGRVINVRKFQTGMLEAGHSLVRGNRPTPVAIYRMAGDDQDLAIRLLKRYRYVV